MPTWSFRVEVGPLRADRFVADHVPALGRKAAAELCDSGCVRREGRRLKKSDLVQSGDVIEVESELTTEPVAEWDERVEILLENELFLIANKPAGMPSGALRGSTRGTLAGALLARYPDIAGVGFDVREPGLVHRLDTETSGALLVARTSEAFTALRAAMTGGELKKTYLALTSSAPPSERGLFRTGLAPEGGAGKRVVETTTGPVRETRYRVLGKGRRLFLVEADVSAAYRHQIRVHFATAGCPLLGDVYYGGLPWRESERHALHAATLKCAQTTGTGLLSFGFNVEAPLPEDFRGALLDDGFDAELVRRFSRR